MLINFRVGVYRGLGGVKDANYFHVWVYQGLGGV